VQWRTYVKHIDLSPPEDELDDGVQCFELPFLSDKEGDWLQEYLPDINEEHCEHWQETLIAKRNWDSVTALILKLCSSSVETLRIHSAKSEISLLRGLLEEADRSQRNPGTPGLLNLRHIDLHFNGNECTGNAFLLRVVSALS
jgi:hypothetical protein